jgi:predicted amidophosphoribosyltransferase
MKAESLKSWAHWALTHVTQFNLALENKPKLLISSKSLSGHLHAERWGQALGDVLSCEHKCLLEPEGRALQKKLSLSHRGAKKFSLIEDFSCEPDERVVFVDDVVTSGNTAWAAFEALGQPPGFEGWSLFYREEKTGE